MGAPANGIEHVKFAEGTRLGGTIRTGLELETGEIT